MATEPQGTSDAPRRTKKTLVWLVVGVSLAFCGAISIHLTRSHHSVSIKLLDGPTLTLVGTGRGNWNVWYPDPNPLRQLYSEVKTSIGLDAKKNVLARARIAARRGRGKPAFLPYTNAVVFWFRAESNCPVSSRQWSVKVVPSAQLSEAESFDFRATGSHYASTTWAPWTPNVLGVMVDDCPTNDPQLMLGFYARGTHEFVGGLSVKNPFFKK